jgi:hypothetical protein
MNEESYVLFDDPNDKITPRVTDESIERRFREYHCRNPRVYELLVQLAREAKQEGRTRIGIKMLWEVVRWKLTQDLRDDEEFKLPNDFHSRYARLIMQQERDLDGICEIRQLRAE